MSLIAYIFIGLFLKVSSVWTSFIQKNTITSGEMYIKINNSLIEPSQIVFVALIYFLVEYISIKVMERMVKKNGNN
ncbi:Msa family membrane protein [Streptococcus salivarius]|uniref:Msa family membrane protein n=1 Tax=Streptococcus salivarius TaxID=1304 RepID=UPI001CF00787|nr:Msa family membrane protein [Streptococcus salivarius]MCA6659199.1 Msa family membrane protein [Streptococcus salivarius]